MRKFYLLPLLAFMMFTLANTSKAQEMMLNGNLETWTDAATPTSWTTIESVSQESAPANVHGGTYSAKHTGGTKKLAQAISGVVAGESYTISLWYKVTAGDGTDARIWSYWRTGVTTLNDHASELRGPNNAYFSNNAGAWTQYTVTLTAPATADNFLFEVRTYSGAIAYYDDFAFFHNASGAVDAPVFSPIAGTYYGAQNVTISTTTAGADIYYTTDGSAPTSGSTLYNGPINIASTTTVKAIGIKAGSTNSAITTALYTIATPVTVANVAALRAKPADNTTVYQLTGQAFLTFKQTYRNQKFVQDATAGILIDDASGKLTTVYNASDGITGIAGTLTTFMGMLQFTPVQNAGAATSTGNVINPLEITAADFVNNFETYEGRLVKLSNVTFTTPGGNFANGQVYAMTDPNTVSVDFRTTFYDVNYIGTVIPAGGMDIVGIANARTNNYISPRNGADMTQNVPVIPVNSAGILIAGLLIAVVVSVRKRIF